MRAIKVQLQRLPQLRFNVAEPFPHNLALISVLYLGERPEISPHDEESEGQNKQNQINQRNKEMKLKKQIAVIVLALTATTSPVWSQDRQALESPTAQALQGTWRVTRHGVDCMTAQDLFSFPAIMTFNQGGTYTGYGSGLVGIQVRGPNTVFGSARQTGVVTRSGL